MLVEVSVTISITVSILASILAMVVVVVSWCWSYQDPRILLSPFHILFFSFSFPFCRPVLSYPALSVMQ